MIALALILVLTFCAQDPPSTDRLESLRSYLFSYEGLTQNGFLP